MVYKINTFKIQNNPHSKITIQSLREKASKEPFNSLKILLPKANSESIELTVVPRGSGEPGTMGEIGTQKLGPRFRHGGSAGAAHGRMGGARS